MSEWTVVKCGSNMRLFHFVDLGSSCRLYSQCLTVQTMYSRVKEQASSNKRFVHVYDPKFNQLWYLKNLTDIRVAHISLDELCENQVNQLITTLRQSTFNENYC